MKVVRLLLLVLLAASSALAQFSAGIKAGVPVTETFETGSVPDFRYFSNTKHWTLGPTIEVHLPFGIGVEFDALYQRLNYSASTFNQPVENSAVFSGNSWEFPLLLKYKPGGGPLRPFVDTGVAFHHISGIKQTGTLVTNPTRVKDFSDGWVLGGGLDLKAIFIHISPEIRYTHWFSSAIQDARGGGGLNYRANQVEFLVGLTF